MTVTEIKAKNKSKFFVCLDHEVVFVLYKGDFNKYHLVEGETVNPEEYEEIMTEVLPKRAMNRSYKLLLSRDYTVKQLQDKLSGDGYPREIIESTVEKLKEEKFLDDERFTENYIFWKSQTKSRKRMMMDLNRKGIDYGTASDAYDDLLEKNDIDNEETIIRKFLDKKGFSADSASYEEKQKMSQTLLRKGFSYESIHHILGYHPFP